MPRLPETPLDVLELAAEGAVVERQFPIAGFERLSDHLARPDGALKVRLELQLMDGTAVGVMDLRAVVVLTCQRCLQPVSRELVSEVRLAFGPREDATVPAEHEVIPGDPRRVGLAELAEDELLLSLPLVARHAEGEVCRLPADLESSAVAAKPETPEMRRPFAGLKDLLKH
ncbi:MAG: DUF177 domain-containing protein [Steroidobacteraceae bacterium]